MLSDRLEVVGCVRVCAGCCVVAPFGFRSVVCSTRPDARENGKTSTISYVFTLVKEAKWAPCEEVFHAFRQA